MKWSNPWKLKGWQLEDYAPDLGKARLLHLDTCLECEAGLPPLVMALLKCEYERGVEDGDARARIGPWPDKSRFWINCRRQRKRGAKICQSCPFRAVIEDTEEAEGQDNP